jgi:hypothetical protein
MPPDQNFDLLICRSFRTLLMCVPMKVGGSHAHARLQHVVVETQKQLRWNKLVITWDLLLVLDLWVRNAAVRV